MKVKIPTQTTCKDHQDSYHNNLIYISKFQMNSGRCTLTYHNFHYHTEEKLSTKNNTFVNESFVNLYCKNCY